MSVVTDLILTCPLFDNDDSKDEDGPICYMKSLDLGRGQSFAYVNDHGPAVGGFKALQQEVFMAAVNYLDWDALRGYLLMYRWEHPENVRLMVCAEDWDAFRTYTLKDLEEESWPLR